MHAPTAPIQHPGTGTYVGKQQKKLFLSGPATKRGGGGKGLATKEKELF